VCDAALLPHILIHDGGGAGSRRVAGWFILAGALAVLALAGPVWERLPMPAFRNDAALIIALDISRVMDAADVKPSRLERAKYKIKDLLEQRKDGLCALLVYAGEAFAVTPLTDDVATIKAQLEAISSDLAPTQGSRADQALAMAGRLLQQAGLTQGDVLLISNGAQLGPASTAAAKLRAQGGRLSVLGAGSAEGAPIPLPEGGFLQDSKGALVVSKLAAPALQQLAQTSGGLYRGMSNDQADVRALLDFFERQAQPGQAAQGGAQVNIEQWEERGPWLLLLVMPIAALAFRRGYLAFWLLFMVLPDPAQALEWDDLWQTRDQRASEALQAGDPARAAALFENPEWKAAAQYKAGQYEDAAKTLENLQSADARYNLGNALAKSGHYPEAIAAYQQALKLQPQHEDARHNKELVEQALQKQQKEQEKQDKNQGPQDKQDKQAGGKDQNQQDAGQDPQEQPAQQEPQPENPKPDTGQQGQPAAEDKAGQPDEAQAQSAQAQEDQAQRGEKAPQRQPAQAAPARQSEGQQATEQWLRRIPDDPGGLLKRKFYYQYQQRQARRRGENP
jgi:Ca-activated chloride channel family protein